MDDDQSEIEKEAIEFVRSNKRLIIEKFCGDIVQIDKNPVSVFMAGSPGAGKTEFSKRFLKELEDKGYSRAIRIDPDEVRAIIPGYNGKNASVFQMAATLGVEKIHDYALEKKKNFLLDTTFSDYKKARDNVARSLKHGRIVSIQYLYQDAKIAWDFTKKREEIEKRGIPVDFFVESLFSAKENVDRIKAEFGDKLTLDLIIKDYTNNSLTTEFNISSIDSHLKIEYTKDELKKILC